MVWWCAAFHVMATRDGTKCFDSLLIRPDLSTYPSLLHNHNRPLFQLFVYPYSPLDLLHTISDMSATNRTGRSSAQQVFKGTDLGLPEDVDLADPRFSKALDGQDPLRGFKQEFNLPTNGGIGATKVSEDLRESLDPAL